MSTTDIVELNARVDEVHLHTDFGYLTAVLNLDLGGTHVGFGTHDLRGKDRAYSFITECMRVTESLYWNDIAGKVIRVMRVKRGSRSTIIAIGHPLKELWFNPSDLWDYIDD